MLNWPKFTFALIVSCVFTRCHAAQSADGANGILVALSSDVQQPDDRGVSLISRLQVIIYNLTVEYGQACCNRQMLNIQLFNLISFN